MQGRPPAPLSHPLHSSPTPKHTTPFAPATSCPTLSPTAQKPSPAPEAARPERIGGRLPATPIAPLPKPSPTLEAAHPEHIGGWLPAAPPSS